MNKFSQFSLKMISAHNFRNEKQETNDFLIVKFSNKEYNLSKTVFFINNFDDSQILV